MENIIYRIKLSDKKSLEFSHYDDKDDQHIGVCVFGNNGMQLDGSLNESELDSLIYYLTKVRESIFNGCGEKCTNSVQKINVLTGEIVWEK